VAGVGDLVNVPGPVAKLLSYAYTDRSIEAIFDYRDGGGQVRPFMRRARPARCQGTSGAQRRKVAAAAAQQKSRPRSTTRSGSARSLRLAASIASIG
jgi:hypothetical protein